jgi:hypothetical protein
MPTARTRKAELVPQATKLGRAQVRTRTANVEQPRDARNAAEQVSGIFMPLS